MRYAGLGILASAALLGGCAQSLVNIADGQATPQTATVRSHMVAGTLGSDGKIAKVTDRTAKGVETNATVNVYRGAPTSTEFSFAGNMDGGTVIPASGRMRISDATARKVLDGVELKTSDMRYESGDAFLQVVSNGEGYVAGRLQNKVGNTGYLGYVVAGDITPAGSVPSKGTATYEGDAVATIFGSRSGQQTAKAKSRIDVDFANGARTVSGKLTKVKVGGKTQNFDIQLRQSKIKGNGYSGGVQLAGAGAVGSSMKSSSYQGSFFGKKAAGTAGTFHFRANGVTLLNRRQNIEVVGAFGGDK